MANDIVWDDEPQSQQSGIVWDDEPQSQQSVQPQDPWEGVKQRAGQAGRVLAQALASPAILASKAAHKIAPNLAADLGPMLDEQLDKMAPHAGLVEDIAKSAPAFALPAGWIGAPGDSARRLTSTKSALVRRRPTSITDAGSASKDSPPRPTAWLPGVPPDHRCRRPRRLNK